MEAIPASVLTGLQALPALKRGRSKAKETDPIRPVHRSVVDATLPYLAGPVRAMVELQWLTGMRWSELTTLRGCDIETTGKVWIYRPPRHKSEHHGKAKEIPLGPKAQQIIKPYLKPDLSAYLFSPMESLRERYDQADTHRRPNQKPNPRKTERTVGERYDRTSYRRAITYGIKAGETVPDWTPHMLRHSAATRLRKTHGLEAARLALGHTSAATTEIYAEIDKAKARQLAAEVG